MIELKFKNHIDVAEEYKKNKELKKEDVKTLGKWLEKQQHLPCISELELILYLQSCYFSIEAAKTAIDTFYTVKTHFTEVFANRNRNSFKSTSILDTALITILPKPTPENHKIVYCKLVDKDSSNFIFTDSVNCFDMSTWISLLQEGTAEGVLIVIDLHNFTLGHLLKMGIMSMKKFLFYLQEALPVRLISLHIINVVPFIDKLLAIIKPFLKKELLNALYLHETSSMETLFEFIPQECMPNDYGGQVGSIAVLHAKMRSNIIQNAEYFIETQSDVADESKREKKKENIGNIFGVEGSFKKLDID